MKLHLGCGRVIIPGWQNLDFHPEPGAIRCDLSKPLPYPDASVDLIFSEHFIEHLTREQGVALLKECRRVLKPGGAVRISTPDLDTLVDAYKSRDLERYKSVGWLPGSAAKMMNEGMRSWGHLFLYCEMELIRAFQEAGFGGLILRYGRGESDRAELRNIDTRPDCGDLILEADKP